MSITEEILRWVARDIKASVTSFKIASNKVIKNEGLLMYDHLTLYKKSLKPIEEMDKTEKTELWQTVKELFPGKEQKELIALCKVVYVIGNYLE